MTDALDPPIVVADRAAEAEAALLTVGVDEALDDEEHAARKMAALATATMGQARARG